MNEKIHLKFDVCVQQCCSIFFQKALFIYLFDSTLFSILISIFTQTFKNEQQQRKKNKVCMRICLDLFLIFFSFHFIPINHWNLMNEIKRWSTFSFVFVCVCVYSPKTNTFYDLKLWPEKVFSFSSFGCQKEEKSCLFSRKNLLAFFSVVFFFQIN